MEKIKINKKIFISRPMSGVTKEEDNKLLKDIREALIKEHVLNNSINAEVVNTWIGPIVPDDISDEQARVWRLGRAISEMATVNVLIFVGGFKGAKGCQVELEVYRQYKDVMADKWHDVFAYRNGKLERLSQLDFSGRYPWGPGKNRCIDVSADLIAELTYHEYPSELIEDAINLSKKILDVGRTNM